MNEGEYRNMEFQSGRMDDGSFYGLLIQASYKADIGNMARLKKGFPDLIESMFRWRSETDYAAKLTKAFRGGTGDIDGKRIE